MLEKLIKAFLKWFWGPPPEPPPGPDPEPTRIFAWNFRDDGIRNEDWNLLLLPSREGRRVEQYEKEHRALALTPKGLKFEVHPGDAVVQNDRLKKKDRVEIGRYKQAEGKLGQVVDYTMRLAIPPGTVKPPGDGFLIICQAHVLEHVNKEVMPSGWPVNISVAGPDQLMLQFKDVRKSMISADNPSGRQGPIEIRRFSFPFDAQVHELTVRIHWSVGAAGFCQASVDGRVVTPKLQGLTMPTPDPMEWKIGCYRGHDVQSIQILLFESVTFTVLET